MAPVVAIIGGGLSGAAVAWHLARSTHDGALRIVVVEPRAELGRGLAYDTPDPEHRINVPEHRMSLDPADPLHFRRWLATGEAPWLPGGSAILSGEVFAPRGVFGQYVARQMRPWLASGRIEHLQTRAVSARREGARWRIGLTGGALLADHVVLAVSHPAPALPAGLAALADDPRLLREAYAPGALAAIGADERVLIVGSGLTGADVVATLAAQGHRGTVNLLSRRGWRSQPHGPKQDDSAADFIAPPERTALGLLRRVRRAVARDAQAGLTWHATFDRLRAQAPQVWAALPAPERRRFLRHLRALWDIHRFRIAPQTRAILEREIARRRVVPLAGRIAGARAQGGALTLVLRLRGAAAALQVDRIILATGPDHASITATNPLLADLARAGEIQPDPLGLRTTAAGAALGADGAPRETLVVAGPLARGAAGDLMGVPDVTAWAAAIAHRLADAIPGARRGEHAA